MHTIGQLSNDVRLLYNYLSEVEIGKIVTYAEINDLLGLDIQDQKNRPILASARRKCMNSDSIVFGVIINEGIKRLSDVEIVSEAERQPPRIRRAARRGVKIATKVADFNQLSNEDKQRHNATVSICGALAQMTAPAKLKQIQREINPTSTQGFAETLRLFENTKVKN